MKKILILFLTVICSLTATSCKKSISSQPPKEVLITVQSPVLIYLPNGDGYELEIIKNDGETLILKVNLEEKYANKSYVLRCGEEQLAPESGQYIIKNLSASQTITFEWVTEEEVDFFKNYKSDRAASRAQSISYYEAIISSESSTSESKNLARSELDAINSNTTIENDIDLLLKINGFCSFSLISSAKINVFIHASTLSNSEAVQIISIVNSCHEFGTDKIIITKVE